MKNRQGLLGHPQGRRAALLARVWDQISKGSLISWDMQVNKLDNGSKLRITTWNTGRLKENQGVS